MLRTLRHSSWLLLLLATAARADFTEFEDRPFQTPGGAEETSLADPQPLPFDGASFTTAYPEGVKLVRGSLDAGDVDVYEITLTAGDLLLASVFDADAGAGVDPVLGVFSGAALPALALDDDDGRGFQSRLGHVAAGGALQVGVSGFGDAAFDGSHFEAPDAIAPYELVLAVVTDPAALEEGDLTVGQGTNDTLASADLLPDTGAAVFARLIEGDVDYFGIDVEEGDRLYAAVFNLKETTFDFADGGRNDPVLGFFEPGGALVSSASDDDAGGQGFVPGRAFTIPPGQGGRWHVAVSGFADAAFDGSHDEPPFEYFLVVARDRDCPNVVPLISGITASTANPYAVAELQGGDHYYTDRTNEQRHVLVDVPPAYECAEWIQTPNDDKNVTVDPHLGFTLSQDASVYIAYDTRATAEPAWLAAGFTPQGDVVDVRDPNVSQEFDVLRRDFVAGPVSLGGNEAPGANSNYLVFALPLDTADAMQAFTVPPTIPEGSLVATISGVPITIAVSPTDTPAQVATALAVAVNADPTLQAARVFAVASGDSFVTTGLLESWSFVTAVPLPGAGWVAPLLLAIGAGALRRRGPGSPRSAP